MLQRNVDLPILPRPGTAQSRPASPRVKSDLRSQRRPTRPIAKTADKKSCSMQVIGQSMSQSMSQSLGVPSSRLSSLQAPLVSRTCQGREHRDRALSSAASSISAVNPRALDLTTMPSSSQPTLGHLDRILQTQRLQDQRLRQVEQKLRSSLNIATVLGATVVETAAFLQARQVSLLRYDPSQSCWQPEAQYCGNQTLAWQPPLDFQQADFPALLASLRQGQPICLDADMANDNAAMEIQRWQARWPGVWLLVPVKRRQTVGYSLNDASGQNGLSVWDDSEHWGIMALAISAPQSWSEMAVAYAQSIVAALEWAIAQAHQHQELLQANQELQKLALSDGLTRLANRRRFDEHLSDEWQRLARDKQPLSLILCDLDHFKRYNDTFGHPAGDRCLIRVARALLNGPQRPADLVARYGGEEFAVILPNTDTHGAWRIAQKIHENIRELKIEHAPDNEEKYVTVTMGVSTVLPGHNSTAQMLIQASDLALYHAKQQGRNRTYVHAHYNTVESDLGRSEASLDMTPPE